MPVSAAITNSAIDAAFAPIAPTFKAWERAESDNGTSWAFILGTPPRNTSVNGSPEFDGPYSDFALSNTLYRGIDSSDQADHVWLEKAKAAGEALCRVLKLNVGGFDRLDFEGRLKFLKEGLLTYLSSASQSSQDDVRNYYARKAFHLNHVVGLLDSLGHEIQAYRDDGHFSLLARGLGTYVVGPGPVSGEQEKPGCPYPAPFGSDSKPKALWHMVKAGVIPYRTQQYRQGSSLGYDVVTISGLSWYGIAAKKGLSALLTGLPLGPVLSAHHLNSLADYPNAIEKETGQAADLYFISAHNDDLWNYLWGRGSKIRNGESYYRDVFTAGDAYLALHPTGTLLVEAPFNIAHVGLEKLGERFFASKQNIAYTHSLLPGHIVQVPTNETSAGLGIRVFHADKVYSNPVYAYGLSRGESVARSAFFDLRGYHLLELQYTLLKEAQARAIADLRQRYPQARLLISDINDKLEKVAKAGLYYKLASGDKLHLMLKAYALLLLVRLADHRALGLPVDLNKLEVTNDKKGTDEDVFASLAYYGLDRSFVHDYVWSDDQNKVLDTLIAKVSGTIDKNNISVALPDLTVAKFGLDLTAGLIPVPGDKARRLIEVMSGDSPLPALGGDVHASAK